jgi:hypothetical protein
VLAHDELPNGSRAQMERAIRQRADRGADLPDLAKEREFGEDDEPADDPRARLLRLIGQRLENGNDQEVASLLGRLEGHGAVSEQRPGASALDQLRHFLRGKGMSEDDIRTACDLSGLGPQRSAMRGGGTAGGAGGALHATSDAGLCAEEQMGQEPVKDRGRGIGRDDFGMLFGLQDKVQQIREATAPRRRRSERELAMDDQARARAESSFNKMFPNAARIRHAW